MPELRFRELPSPTSSNSVSLAAQDPDGILNSSKKRVKPYSNIWQTAMATNSQRSFVRQCPRARRVRFFRNGDQYFKGIWYAISSDRFRSFEALLEDLNRSVVGGDLVNLPHGVRCLFTIDGQKKITNLDELIDGESYVCASNEAFKKIDYENAREPVWSYSLPKQSRIDPVMSPSIDPTTGGVFSRSGGGGNTTPENVDFIYPKIITVVRNGVKPRRAVRLLLNKRTARSFDQVLAEITTAIKLDCGIVKKLFTLNGKQVTGLCDFFRSEDIFIACGSEKMSVDDFYLDSEEYKCLWSPKIRPPAATNILRNDLVSTSRTPPFSRRSMVVDNNVLSNATITSTSTATTTTAIAAPNGSSFPATAGRPRRNVQLTARPSPVLRRRFFESKESK